MGKTEEGEMGTSTHMMHGMMSGSGMTGKGMMSQQDKTSGQEMMGSSGMMCPMCGRMMGQQGMMGGHGMMMNMMPMMQRMMSGSGMMGSDMMCPMCGKIMGGTGKKTDLIALAKKLDLSEEQIDEIKGIFLAHKKNMIRKKADRDIAELELSELVQDDDPDLEAIETKIRKIADIEANMRFSEIKTMVDAKSVLTAEQKAALKKIMKTEITSMMQRKKMKETKTSMQGSSGHSEHHQ
jgi:Spy/CpxP family protein refolding chaperone